MKQKLKLIKINYSLIFIVFSLISSFLTIIILIKNHGSSWNDIFFFDPVDSFMDFFNPINHSYLANPYMLNTIYPPFAYLLFFVVSLFIPKDLCTNAISMQSSYEGIIMLIVCSIICIYLLIITLMKFINNKEINKNLFVFCVISSLPFLNLYQRGNIIILALVFAILFFVYKDDDNIYLRELALISLAISANIKLYPAVFGLVLIKEKKFKQAIRCIIYAVILFLVSMMLMGGLDKISLFLNNLIQGVNYTGEVGFRYKVNFSNTITLWLSIININVSESIIMKYVYFSVLPALIIFFFQKNKWKSILLLTLLLIGVPGISFTYSLVFLIIPLVTLINSNDKEKFNFLYVILISFALISFAFIPVENLYNISTMIEGFSVLMLYVVLLIDGVMLIFNKKGKKHEKSSNNRLYRSNR